MIQLLFAGDEAVGLLNSKSLAASVTDFARYGVGFLRCGSETFCILPSAFRVGTPQADENLADVGLLVRSLGHYARLRERSRNVDGTQSSAVSDVCNDLHWASRIEAAISLVDDYLCNGVWRRETRIRADRPPGRIHWDRTVDRCVPLITRDAIVYEPPAHTRSVQDWSDPLWGIWADCLRQAVVFLGFKKLNTLPFPSLQREIPPHVARSVCRENGVRVFDDRSRRIVGFLEAFLALRGTTTSASVQQTSWLRISHEEHLWEAVVRNAITGTDIADHAYDLPPMPAGSWNTGEGAGRQSGLRLDCRTLVDCDREQWLLVADAKRYDKDAEVTGADLYKQWLYAYFSSDAYHSSGFRGDRIANVLLMPAGGRWSAQGTGIYRMTRGASDRHPFGTVIRFELDYRRALELFLSRRAWPHLAQTLVVEWKRLQANDASRP